ncbi:putative disease resistance RPP13-like protein 1 isoform X3 [Humulus lupulus]|uniref:putative disease resistance RPP13-like protein 1 isoform X3 n=1 Tax=Humulus lupulus TaxID=3486 RepID=UPI002B4104C8|nr:putative disease resistance RPP13-like protein 1 isoform X3 [Humulus lupulus]
MVAELIGGALLSAFLDPLVEKLASEVKDFFKGKETILKLVKELNTTLSSAGLLLIDAEEKLIKDQRVKKWLDDLKDTIYAANDLVYKIDTEALRDKLESESQSGYTCCNKVLMKLIPTPLTPFDKTIKSEIGEILRKLKLLLENKDLGLKRIEKEKHPERLCAPLVEESDVYGRDDDRKTILNLLLSDDMSGDKFSVIPIVGMGGMGKTTLAQLVYNDEGVNQKFETKVWVTVGDESKLDKVMKKIIQKVDHYEKCEIEEQFEHLDKVKKVLAGKKFLVVLDDVWDEDRNCWEVLKSCFTTRSHIVASIMETESTHYLQRISFDKSWELFAKFASIDDLNSYEQLDNLEEIGRKIVDKCKGLPLAIKVLGGLLRGKKKREDWNDVLNNDIWELYERSSIGILPTLWLSYFYLPSHLKPCFAYCAIFPKDYEYKKEDMMLLWMAEGFLHPKQEKPIEKVGEEYFQDLISR